MCNHVFNYPEDTRENYNPDGKTLTGICRYCGVKKNSYGMRWLIPRWDDFIHLDPIGEVSDVDKTRII